MSTPAETQTPHSPATRKNSGLHLPLEIITLIVSFIPIGPDSQSQLHALTLVSRSFYSASVARLYHSPHLRGWRFELFVRTVCPSINSWIKRNGLSDFTVRLDLSRLVHEARKSVTARLLGRLKGRLEFFAAPQASFGINSLAALSKCSNLQSLDLSWVTESLPAADLCRATSKLDHLQIFYYPHSGLLPPSPITDFTICPPHVRRMYITGCLKLDVVKCSYLQWPSSLMHLGIEDCIDVAEEEFTIILSALGPQLQSLEVGEGMSKFGTGTLRRALSILPRLHTLKTANDHLRYGLYRPSRQIDHSNVSPLVQLELTYLGRNHTSPWAWVWHFVMDGVFPNVRQIRVRRYAAWVDPFEESSRAGKEGGPPVIDDSHGGTWLIPYPSQPVEYSVVEASWNDR